MDMAKILKSGNSQAIHLPKAYRFEGKKVYLKRVGNALLLIPEQDAWNSLIESVYQFSDDFMTDQINQGNY